MESFIFVHHGHSGRGGSDIHRSYELLCTPLGLENRIMYAIITRTENNSASENSDTDIEVTFF